MKKFFLVALAFASFATVTSCDKDDDAQASLEGKWEYSREGIAAMGQEVLTDYVHEDGCAKDYTMINASTVVDHTFFGDACTEDVFTTTYSRSGNTITFTEAGETYSAEIKTLDANTLKIYATDPDLPQVTQVTVYKRVN
jgi:hypothetical protein